MTVREFFDAFGIQRRVIGALVLREMITRYGRHNIGFLWIVAEPMMFTLGVAGLWTIAKADHGSSLPIVAFAVTGYSSVLMWRNSASRCAKAVEPNLSLLYHRYVKVIDIFLARLILEIAGTTISFIVLTLFFMAIGWIAPPPDMSLVLIGWFMLAWFGVSLALIIGALTERSEVIERFWHTASYLLFPLSGAMFMVDWLPPIAQQAVLILPMVHGVEVLREGYFGGQVHAHYDLAYMATVCLVMTWIGLILTEETGRRVEPE